MFGINEIWGLIIVPAIATIILLIYFRKSTVWWEYAVVWVATVLVIWMAQVTTESTAVSDREFWGHNSQVAFYNEPFQYWTTCSEEYACGETCSGSGSSRSCTTKYCTRYYPCKEWGGDDAWILDQNNKKHDVSPALFKDLEKRWKNTYTIELNRQATYDIVVDGDRRRTIWPQDWRISEPLIYSHTYENRTQCTSTIQFLEITDETIKRFGLFDYPKLRGHTKRVIQDQAKQSWPDANKYFEYVNGKLGPVRFVHFNVLIFRDKPHEAFSYQESFWKNGNKNEFNICIGATKSGEIEWADVISWTEKEDLKIEARDFVYNMKNVSNDTMMALAKWCEDSIGPRFVKPEFTSKFRHLAIQPSTTSIIMSAIVILLTCGGICWWVIKNDFDSTTWGQHYNNRRY